MSISLALQSGCPEYAASLKGSSNKGMKSIPGGSFGLARKAASI